MNSHKDILTTLCRLCRKKIKLDSKYTTAKLVASYSKAIKSLFSYDIKTDSVDIHPSSLCSTCRRKMDRCSASSNIEYQTMPIAIFESHGENCSVCDRNVIPHKFSVKVVETESDKPRAEELLIKNLVDIAKSFSFVKLDCSTSSDIIFSKFVPDGESYKISISVHVNSDFKWRVFVYGKCLPSECFFAKNVPDQLNSSNVCDYFDFLNTLKICPGNPDFENLVGQKLNKGEPLYFEDKNGSVKAHLENNNMINILECTNIRVIDCGLLIEQDIARCQACTTYRDGLRSKSARRSSEEQKQNIYIPNKDLSREGLLRKVTILQQDKKNLMRKRSHLEKKIDKILAKESINIDKESSDLFSHILDNEGNDFPPDSPQRLLWEEQKHQAKLKNSKSMRWHPVIIRWCLSIYLKSPTTYQHLRDGGFLKLPHQSTLSQYTGFTSIMTGFNPDVLELFAKEIKIETLQEKDKNCSILFDEMKIKSGLVFNKNSGKLIGFTELGGINDEIDKFSRNCDKEQSTEPNLATHVMTFMARGLFKRYNYPIGYFAAVGFDAHQLFPCVWEAVRILEFMGFMVRAFVCDGASPNRKFYKIHLLKNGINVSEDGVVYWAWNRFAKDRKIFFICDPPHLIKTVRNNWENSYGNHNTRQLLFHGKKISWQHLVSVYQWDMGPVTQFAPRMTKLHKLTNEHVNLNGRLRMRVYLAAQVLSSSVANALDVQNLPDTLSTRQFIRLMDKFFDCLNVNSTYDGQKQRKEFLLPYESVNDYRFEWLKNTFLGFINGWKHEADSQEHLPKDIRNRLCLSYQTLEGLRITVHSFLELARILLNIDGVEYFLSDKLNQDPLEEHFGKQRMRGGGNDNPSLLEYGQNERKIILTKSSQIRVMGNTRGRKREEDKIDVFDESELPKRKKKDL